MADYQSSIVEILKDGTLKPAFVIEEAAKKLIVVDENGRQFAAPLATIVCKHNISTKRDNAATTIAELKAQKEELIKTVDIELLWEGVNSSQKEYNTSELATAYFSESTANHCAALCEILLQDKLFFKQKGLTFTPRSPEKVTELIESEKRRLEKEAFKTKAKSWIKNTIKAVSIESLTAEPKILNQLEDYLTNGNTNDSSKILNTMFKQNAKEAAWKILKKWGRLTEHNDPTLLIAGIKPVFSEDIISQAEGIAHFSEKEVREKLSLDNCFSIDDPETKEVDDAISVYQTGESIRIEIHIADISFFVKKESALDKEALHRTISIYLPTQTVTMFPKAISCDKASLIQDCPRPALSLVTEFDKQGTLLSFQFFNSKVKVKHRLSYEETDSITPEHPLYQQISLLQTITDKLAEQRLKANGFIIKRPEAKIKVSQDSIELSVISPDSASRKMVQELMILYNSLAARFAIENNIPVIFRAQPSPNKSFFPVGKVIEYKAGEMGPIFKQLKPARLSLKPLPHSGLGVPAYIQASSPIRRYADLIIQRQLSAFIANQPLPYQKDDLWRILAAAEATEKEMSTLEKKSKQFWILKYMEANPQQRYQAAILSTKGKQPIVELVNLGVRGLLSGEHSNIKQKTLSVKITEISPENSTLLLSPDIDIAKA